MTTEHEENGASTTTLARSRDRASQIDFLRELSVARRGGRSPSGPQPAVDDSTDTGAPGPDAVSDVLDETPWTVAFVPTDSETAVEPQSSADDWAMDDTDGAAWSSFPTEAALLSSNWFDHSRSESSIELGAPAIGLFDILPVVTWPDPAASVTAERSESDIGQAVESLKPGDVSSGGDKSGAADGPFDFMPATTWPRVVPHESSSSGTSSEVEELLATRSWVLDRSEPITGAESVGASTTAHRAIVETNHVLEHSHAAPSPAPVTVRERVANAPTATPGNRPPTITASTPVVARCSGVVASRIARGRCHTVLSGVDLTVRIGEVVVITGRSGSGKTTLLECLGGLHRVDAGTITIGETVLGAATEEQIADLRATSFGYVAQEPQLLADLSAIENIELPLLLSGWDPADARTEADAAVSLVRLQQPTFRASELSSGERRRVAIARALVGEPSIIWLDDANAAIDPKTMAEIYELIFELCQDGMSVVAVTHDPVLLACATSTYELRDGSLHPVGE